MDRKVWKTLWTGLRLACPNCGVGRIYTGFRPHKKCTHCGVAFERTGEGDFLVTVVAAYGVTAVLLAALVFALNVAFPGLPVELQLGLCLAAGAGVLLVGFRHLKGVSVALVHLTFGLKAEPTGSDGEGGRK